jgi:Flp pilus assembly protein TadD
VLTLYGRALLQDGDIDGAEQTFALASRRYPIEPTAFLLYASTAERQNHTDAARTALIRYGSIATDEEDFSARAARIAALSLRLNDAPSAVHWLEQAASGRPNDVKLLALLAEAQLRAGDRDTARTTIARGLDKDPQNTALINLKVKSQK